MNKLELRPLKAVSAIFAAVAMTFSMGVTAVSAQAVDTLAPVINAPVNGSTITSFSDDPSSYHPVFVGTGEPGAALTLMMNNSYTPTVGTTTVDSNGDWTMTIADVLYGGSYSYYAYQYANGSYSPNSANTVFTMTQFQANAPVIVSPEEGASVDEVNPLVSGTGEVGASVSVKFKASYGYAEPIGTTTVDSEGKWSVTFPSNLSDGTSYSITANQNYSGSQSIDVTRDFSVNLFHAATPVIISPATNSTVDTATPIISGTGFPGAALTVGENLGYGETSTVGTTTVDIDGNWSLIASIFGNPERLVKIYAYQTYNSSQSSRTAEKNFTIALFQTPNPTITSPVQNATVNVKRPVISGMGYPGAVLTLNSNSLGYGTLVGTTTVAANGTWSITFPYDLSDGVYRVQSTQKFNNSNSYYNAEQVFTVLLPPVATVSGTPMVKSTLTVSVAPIPSGSRITAYKWYRNGRQISNATKSSYRATQTDYNKTVYAQIDLFNSSTRKKTILKSSSVYVLPAPMTVSSSPKITGVVQLGRTVKVNKGHWSPNPTKFTYKWLINGVVVSGATKSSYKIPSIARGQKLSVEVTGTKNGYAATPARSAEKQLSGTALTVKKVPALSGTFKSNYVAKVSTGSWTPSPSKYSFKWLLNGVVVPGATSSSYRVPLASAGKSISAQVTAYRGGYDPITVSSLVKTVA